MSLNPVTPLRSQRTTMAKADPRRQPQTTPSRTPGPGVSQLTPARPAPSQHEPITATTAHYRHFRPIAVSGKLQTIAQLRQRLATGSNRRVCARLSDHCRRTPRQPAAAMKNRLKHFRYRPDSLMGFLARTGLSIEPESAVKPRPWPFGLCSQELEHGSETTAPVMPSAAWKPRSAM